MSEISVSHILVMHEDSERSTATRSKEEAFTQIETLQKRLTEGEDFAALAKECSDCPSGRDGGELGTFSRGAMVPEFDAAAFTLGVGADSDVVTTSFGFHIIRRTG